MRIAPRKGIFGGKMHDFPKILSIPENIPILVMLITVVYLAWLSIKESRKSNRLLDKEKKIQAP